MFRRLGIKLIQPVQFCQKNRVYDYMDIYIIYRILNTKTRKFYIGRTKQSLAKRWKTHKQDGRKERRYQGGSYLYRSMRKHGIENFEIKEIDCADGLIHAKFLENFYIKYYNSDNKKYGYNLLTEDKFGDLVHSEETKEKIRLKSYVNMAKAGKTGVSFDKTTKKWALNFDHKEFSVSKLFEKKE